MANNSKKSNSPDDENDPFNFFKFPGPDSNNKGDNNKNKKPENGHKIPFFVILIAVIGFLFLIQSLASSVRNEGFIEYSKFRSLVENGTIVNVEINDSYLIGY